MEARFMIAEHGKGLVSTATLVENVEQNRGARHIRRSGYFGRAVAPRRLLLNQKL
jgi:hypothetical protein